MDIWTAVTTDRLAFADYLATLTPEQWGAATWCSEWTVRDVVAHLLVPPTMSRGQVFAAFAKSGFNLDKMSAKLIARTTMPTGEIVATTRRTAGVQSAPPGLKPIGVFAELLVHAADISLAIGQPLQFSTEHYIAGLDHLKSVQPVLGCKRRIAGLELRATDANWSTGSGPLVEGGVQHLIAAVTGRRQALNSLTGAGVATLASR